MRTDQMSGGTNRAGVPAAAFAMPAGSRIRYDMPAAALAECVTGYAIYACDDRRAMSNWYLPAPGMIVLLIDAGRVEVAFRNRAVADVPKAGLWGPTGHAYRTTTHGGISVGIGLTAEGWARLAPGSARGLRERIVPLGSIAAADAVAKLVAAIGSLDDDAGIAPTLDRLLPELFGAPGPGAMNLRALDRLLASGEAPGVRQAADRLGLGEDALRRLTVRDHGMASKALLTRARFLRSFARWLAAGAAPTYAGIDAGYHDSSHFLRDADIFLGTTPLRFVKRDTLFLRASIRARAAVLGAPAHALYGAAGTDPGVPRGGEAVILTGEAPLSR